MSILDLFRSRPRVQPTGPTAPVAKERLQILLTHERAARSQPEYLPRLRRELLDVIARYAQIEEEKIWVHYENKGNTSKLELNIELPNAAEVKAAADAKAAAEAKAVAETKSAADARARAAAS
jgi:cell division topological specificity factor